MSESASVLDYREPEWVAKKLGLDKNTVYKYLQEGWLPGVQLGRKWLISERLLAEHLEKETRAQTATRRQELPQTPRLKRALELGERYAAARGQEFCGTEHAMIGMIQEAENFGVVVLKNLKIDLAQPQAIFESRVPEEKKKVHATPMTDRLRTALRLAQEQAIGMGHTYIGCETLLLGLLLEPTGMAGEILRSLGVSYEAARAEILKLVQGRE
jgi:ATP-dependent Clp protease ATP-binding subunit ClpC